MAMLGITTKQGAASPRHDDRVRQLFLSLLVGLGYFVYKLLYWKELQLE